MSRAYDMWIHQQIEPDDVIVTGNYRRVHEVKPAWMWKKDWFNKNHPNEGQPKKPVHDMTDAEIDEYIKEQDAYLELHGVSVNCKTNNNEDKTVN